MPRRAYRDRTRGGTATACGKGVDLDQAILSGGTVKYKGRRPQRTRRIGRGSFGVVSLYTYADGTQFTVKKQQAEWDAIENLPVAESLKACGLVDFKAVVDTRGSLIWTFMEYMTSDCRAMPLLQRRLHAPEFAKFLLRTLNCLLAANAGFCDMKLGNCAVKTCEPIEFRLIDIDGVNGDISTYPAVAQWASECELPEEKRLQTRYAFAVAAMMFEQPNDVFRPFYHDSLAPIEERMRLLQAHASATTTDDVYRMIQKHAIPVLRALQDSRKYPLHPQVMGQLYPSLDRTSAPVPMSVDTI